MIKTYDEAHDLLKIDPDVEPEIFWPRIGITEEAVRAVGEKCAEQYGIEFPSAMACIEIGATLARPDAITASGEA